MRLQIWEPVSRWYVYWRVLIEKNRICLSAVPPPEAKIEGFWSFHPIALTAAVCSLNLINYFPFSWEYTTSLLSFPPEAMYLESGLHLSPQIYWKWALYLFTSPPLISQIPTHPSLDPLAKRFFDQQRLPILP